MVTETQIKEKALELGFHGVGIASVDSQDLAVSHLKSWLERGYQADMDWMTNPKRQDIKTLWPEVRSLICLALNYYTPQQHSQEQNHGKISRYAWGRDYHKVLSKKLKALSQWLESQGEQIQTRYYVDTGPVQDKVWAQRAGIGWIAKNGNLITRNYGSWVFLGEILTNLPLEPDRPHSAHCGTCSRCLSACPTQAIVSPYVVDANRCIAYHTIENRAVTLPTEIAKNLQGWVAGCDICQDVCPWNQRFAQVTDVEDFQPRPENLSPRLEELANLTIEEWDRRFISSALRRIKPQQWRRNAQANLAHSPHPPQDDN
ncbi:tRNA epoxyqueuosine(34) reductase QueG [Microcystis aeruginosa NIES-298]|uniref:Epoxyqueuosine reductase n=1 Tax=Microcystis aeruginosa NIES-298 TaxID=449468 RepID=A0A2H6BTM7_MICAE|nr:tRNA epoxyqueuosine(34) reductase QueG [Microcystis aeruginosa]QHU81997.1 tRNA epoxyqueuosine(34) reductase QueG [Microcystis aeruginosa NIES-298]GBD53543.1 4Fe-4S cluster binding protein like [Microcystis aeruginosa NIES-298]GBE99679.1 epoxyqueuosine reductase [Microcystis aeruginosa NIES-298]